MTRHIRIYGIVQGVGFRPFVKRLADRYGIFGTVSNKGSYVEIFAQAIGFKTEESADRLFDSFVHALKSEAPPRSMIFSIEERKVKDNEQHFDNFSIADSEKECGDIFVSPDIGICDECRAELFDANNRRYLHPFINCTNCGPRLTILDSMPYDRERTSMGEFEMCPECRHEYTNPANRRYDAQPVCCNKCGPGVYILGKKNEIKDGSAITFARRAIMQGGIVAVKGIGGFHLCADAKNTLAVKRLRMLKHRPQKPFAVMAKDMDTAKRECVVEDYKTDMLNGWQKPIVLLKKKKDSSLSGYVAPDNPSIGVMLPYAPLQLLLFSYNDDVQMTDTLVMTSGNVSGAPICRSDEEAQEQIGSFCDMILSHDRKIRIRADDTVMDFIYGKPYMIRRSRGFAPLPVMVTLKIKNKESSGNKNKAAEILAIGGELKNTFCIAKDNMLYLSPFVGDMADIRTVNALKECVARMEGLLEAKPQTVVCDMHPKYNSCIAAEEIAAGCGAKLVRIQHHYAHILSCMAENDFSEKVIGVSFDGTGYGNDAAIWGGELMLADTQGFERIGSIKPFIQAGGDASSKEGFRIASAMIHQLYAGKAWYNEEEIAKGLKLCDEKTYKLISVMVDRHINSITSTSAGRLFDAVSAILGIRTVSTFEGEASMALEFAAEKFIEGNPMYSLDFDGWINSNENMDGNSGSYKNENFEVLDTDLIVKYIIREKLSPGCSNFKSCRSETGNITEDENEEYLNGRLAFDFHMLLSEMVVRACGRASHKYKTKTAALSGGVFQNKLFTGLCADGMRKIGLNVLIHSLVPPNDGGIALGQAFALACRMNED